MIHKSKMLVVSTLILSSLNVYSANQDIEFKNGSILFYNPSKKAVSFSIYDGKTHGYLVNGNELCRLDPKTSSHNSNTYVFNSNLTPDNDLRSIRIIKNGENDVTQKKSLLSLVIKEHGSKASFNFKGLKANHLKFGVFGSRQPGWLTFNNFPLTINYEYQKYVIAPKVVNKKWGIIFSFSNGNSLQSTPQSLDLNDALSMNLPVCTKLLARESFQTTTIVQNSTRNHCFGKWSYDNIFGKSGTACPNGVDLISTDPNAPPGGIVNITSCGLANAPSGPEGQLKFQISKYNPETTECGEMTENSTKIYAYVDNPVHGSNSCHVTVDGISNIDHTTSGCESGGHALEVKFKFTDSD